MATDVHKQEPSLMEQFVQNPICFFTAWVQNVTSTANPLDALNIPSPSDNKAHFQIMRSIIEMEAEANGLLKNRVRPVDPNSFTYTICGPNDLPTELTPTSAGRIIYQEYKNGIHDLCGKLASATYRELLANKADPVFAVADIEGLREEALFFKKTSVQYGPRPVGKELKTGEKGLTGLAKNIQDIVTSIQGFEEAKRCKKMGIPFKPHQGCIP